MCLDKFLDVLNTELPPICADKDLVKHLPNIFKNTGTLTRMRARGETPSHFYIAPNIYYLRDDVISWLRDRYQTKEKTPKPKQKTSTNRSKDKHEVAETRGARK